MKYGIVIYFLVLFPFCGTAVSQVPDCEQIAGLEQKMASGFKGVKYKKCPRTKKNAAVLTFTNIHQKITGAVSSHFWDIRDTSGISREMVVCFYNSTDRAVAQEIFNGLIRQFTACSGTRYRMIVDQQDETVEGKSLLKKSYFYFIEVKGDAPIDIVDRKPGHWVIISLDRSAADTDQWAVYICFEILEAAK